MVRTQFRPPTLYTPYRFLFTLKGLFHPKMNMRPSFILPDVVPNLYNLKASNRIHKSIIKLSISLMCYIPSLPKQCERFVWRTPWNLRCYSLIIFHFSELLTSKSDHWFREFNSRTISIGFMNQSFGYEPDHPIHSKDTTQRTSILFSFSHKAIVWCQQTWNMLHWPILWCFCILFEA